MAVDEGCILSIHNPAALVSIFGDDDFHALVRKDGSPSARAAERTRLRGRWSLNSLPTMMLLTCCAAVREMVMTDVSSNWLKAEISSSSR